MDARIAAVALIAVIAGIALGYAVAAGRGATVTSTSMATMLSTTTVTKAVTTTYTVTSTVTKATTVTATLSKTVTARRIVLVDALGRTVVLSRPARRVASLAPSITETICMMGLCGRLVAVDQYSLSIRGVPKNVVNVGGFWQPSPEKILEAKPDIVLACSGVPAQERLARQLEQEGVKVFFTRCDKSRDWNDIKWDVKAIGELLGAPEKAAKLINWMDSQLSRLSGELVNTTRPGAALIVYLSSNGAWVAGGGTFQDTMLSTAGARNVFHSLYGWQMVGYEDLVAKNMSYVFITTMGSESNAEKLLEAVAKTPLARTRAYKEGHICVLYGAASNAVSRPSPEAVLGAELLAHLMHPGRVPAPSLEGYICGPSK